MTPRQRERRWPRRLLLLVLVASGSLAVAELVLHGTQPRPLSNLVPHPVLNHVWRAGTSKWHREFAGRGTAPYEHRYNTQGWVAAQDFAREKPPATFRLAYLGDSFTEGTCAMDRSLPSLVGAGLTPFFAQHGLALEVLNTGTSSHSPVLHAVRLQTQLLAFTPDLIVVNLDMTDVFDDYLYAQTAERDAAGRLVAAPPGIPLHDDYVRTSFGLARKTPRYRFNIWMREHSRIFDLLRPTIRLEGTLRDGVLVSDDGLPSLYDWCTDEPWGEQTGRLVAFSMRTLTELAALARSNGVALAVTAVPHREQFLGTWTTAPFEAVRETCVAAGVPYIDSFGPMRARMGADDPEDYYIPDDMHFNDRGYALWAEVQREFLERELLPALLGSR